MKKMVSAVGPTLAGFNAFGHLANVFTLGALGSWFREYWLPLTRGLWGRLLELFPIDITLTAADKDVLTTIVFFLPLAIYAFFRKEDKEQINTKLVVLIALLLSIIVGLQVMLDTWNLLLLPLIKALLFYLIIALPIYLIGAPLFKYLRRRSQKQSTCLDPKTIYKVNEASERVTTAEVESTKKQPLSDKYGWLKYLPLMLVIFGVGFVALLITKEANFLRLIAPFFLLGLVCFVTVRTPTRIVLVGMIIFGLVIGSFGYDFISNLKIVIEK